MRSVVLWGTVIALLLCAAACGGGGGGQQGIPAPGAAKPDNESPVFSAVSGARDGSSLVGTAIIRASATDDVAVAQVTLDLDGKRLAASTDAELEYSLNTQGYALGAHKLLLRATDAAGRKGEMELRVNFLQGVEPEPLPEPPPPAPGPPPAAVELPATGNENLPEVTLPGIPPDPSDTVHPRSVLLTGVQVNAKVWGTVRFGAQGIDDKGIWRMEIWYADQLIAFIDDDRYLETDLDTRLAPDGRRNVSIRLFDYGGNAAVCNVPLNVENDLDHENPWFTVRPSYRVLDAVGNVLLVAEAMDDKGMAGLTLHIDGEQVAQASGDRLEYNWPTTAGPDGVYQVVFTATDKAGKQTLASSYQEVANSTQRYVVSGTLYAPNGVDPLPNIGLRVPKALAPEKWLTVARSWGEYGYHEEDGNDEVWTDHKGHFEISGVPPGPRRLELLGLDDKVFKLGVPYTVGNANLTLPKAQTTLSPTAEGLPNITVVTGDNEGLENWFAKYGYGQVDAQGKLILGTEKFLLVDGNDSLPAGYMDFPQYMSIGLKQTSMLCISAGNHYEQQLFDTPAWVAALRDWSGVDEDNYWGSDQSRRIYCGGDAYDFIEQAFPEEFDFRGVDTPDRDPTLPEPRDQAQLAPARPASQAQLYFDNWNGSPNSAMPWLQSQGFPSLQPNTWFALPLAAGTVQVRRWYSYGTLATDETLEDAEGHYELLSVGHAHGGHGSFRLVVHGLPVPKAPSPQWTLQERLLELMLNPFL